MPLENSGRNLALLRILLLHARDMQQEPTPYCTETK